MAPLTYPQTRYWQTTLDAKSDGLSILVSYLAVTASNHPSVLRPLALQPYPPFPRHFCAKETVRPPPLPLLVETLPGHPRHFEIISQKLIRARYLMAALGATDAMPRPSSPANNLYRGSARSLI